MLTAAWPAGPASRGLSSAPTARGLSSSLVRGRVRVRAIGARAIRAIRARVKVEVKVRAFRVRVRANPNQPNQPNQPHQPHQPNLVVESAGPSEPRSGDASCSCASRGVRPLVLCGVVAAAAVWLWLCVRWLWRATGDGVMSTWLGLGLG
jgi:hypothetical protein